MHRGSSSGIIPKHFPVFVPKQYRNRNSIRSDYSSSGSYSVSGPSGTVGTDSSLQRSNHSAFRPYQKQNNRKGQHTYDIGGIGQHKQQTHTFMAQIQRLNYKNTPFRQLKQQFIAIVQGEIHFEGVYPRAVSEIGRQLLTDGLFHQMWGRVLKKSHQEWQPWLYHQRYLQTIRSNYSNYEQTFNRQSSYQVPLCTEEVQQNSNTNLRDRRPIKQGQKESKHESYQRSNQRKQAQLEHGQEQKKKCIEAKGTEQVGRLRLLGQQQSNSRRLNAQIVCLFLNIKRAVPLEDIEIVRVLESCFGKTSEVAIMKACLSKKTPYAKRDLLSGKAQTVLVAYGKVSFSMLLRLKMTYQRFEALVVFHETFSLRLWLQQQGLIAVSSLS